MLDSLWLTSFQSNTPECSFTCCLAGLAISWRRTTEKAERTLRWLQRCVSLLSPSSGLVKLLALELAACACTPLVGSSHGTSSCTFFFLATTTLIALSLAPMHSPSVVSRKLHDNYVADGHGAKWIVSGYRVHLDRGVVSFVCIVA